MSENNFEDDFVIKQRRFKERAAAAFEEDLAELRRKRRDMQDRIFDVIDLNAEIEKARNTLEAAEIAFQRHATKFDNTEAEDRDEDGDERDATFTRKLDRSRKLTAGMETVQQRRPVHKPLALKWSVTPNCEPAPEQPAEPARQSRIGSLIDDPRDTLAVPPSKRTFLKRKKTVSF